MNSIIEIYKKTDKELETIYAVSEEGSYVHIGLRNKMVKFFHVFSCFDNSLIKGCSKLSQLEDIETLSHPMMEVVKGSLQAQDEYTRTRIVDAYARVR